MEGVAEGPRVFNEDTEMQILYFFCLLFNHVFNVKTIDVLKYIGLSGNR